MEKQEIKKDTQKMTEMYKERATPGQPHKLLAKMTGSWTAKTKNWIEPDKPPAESAGICERKMILGERYLQEEFTGDMMGSPFSGIGFTGYDNHAKKYVMVWMDTMSTGIYFFEGRAGVDGKTITMEGRSDDPVKGPMKWRSVTTFVNDNTHLFEMRGVDKNGKEEKMEITYIRKPAS